MCVYETKCQRKHCQDPNGCMIQLKLDYLFDEAGVSVKNRAYKGLRTDDDGTDTAEFQRLSQIENAMVGFVDGGYNLLIHSGNVGCGKTSWAFRLLQAYFKKIWLTTPMTCRALFISVPQYLQAVKEAMSNPSPYIEHVNKYLTTCDLVIWDDIGTKNNATAFEADLLLAKLEARIYNGKANIFTSNLSDNELQQCLGDRLASRICHLGENITLHGGDKRGVIQ